MALEGEGDERDFTFGLGACVHFALRFWNHSKDSRVTGGGEVKATPPLEPDIV